MTTGSNSTVITLISVLIAGGGLGYGVQIVQAWLRRPRRGIAHQQMIEASIVTVSRARDQLEDDNTRIRAERDEDRIRFAADRAEWTTERLALRADISRLEAQIRMEREQAAARYDSLLEHVHSLQRRTLGGEAPDDPHHSP